MSTSYLFSCADQSTS